MGDRRPFVALLVASGSFVVVLDTFAAAVAFPRIEEAFPSTPRATLAWVNSGYSIALAAFLLTAGKLGDRYGLRRVYLVGMAVFATGAGLSALAPTPALLIAARVLQGSAGAMMISTAIALALMEYPPERRGVAMGWLGVMGSVASLAGPVLAGNIIDIGGSWRWVFLVSLPVAALTLLAGPRYLREVRVPAARDQPFDLLGVALGAAASGLLTLAVLESGRWGVADPRTLGLLGASLLLFGLFTWRCRVSPSPLLELGIFRRRRLLVATVSQLGSQFSIFAFFFWVPLFLANVWGWSAAGAGWAIAVPLVVSFSSVSFGRFADRHGYRGVLVVGGLFGAASLLWCVVALGDEPAFTTQLLPALLLIGWGIGMVGITSAAAALAGLGPEDLAMANSAFQTTRRVVQTLGLAAVVAILGERSADSLALFQRVWAVSAGGFLFSVVVALWYPAGARADEEARVGAAAADDGALPSTAGTGA